jgi:hypothetical protein
MHAGRLVIVCGAGLSMAPPSNLPAAWRVAESCFDKYRSTVDPDCDVGMRNDLERFAQHFADQHTLESVFIESLVPWNDFVRPPNQGHAAVADFLVTRVASAALSANYDPLIERSAIDNGFDFQNSLDGEEATVRMRTQSPLLKFHGCATRDRPSTVWTATQLDEPRIAQRIAKTKEWLTANLRQKDLLVVGFWTDWDYLNRVLGTVLEGIAPLSVTVVDPAGLEVLRTKAPQLWELAHGQNVNFLHVQESGAQALEELRKSFSANYLKAVLEAGRAVFEQWAEAACDPRWLEIADFDTETLYGLRRDAEGVPSGRPATLARPTACEALGAFHLMLRRAGAVATPQGYDLANKSIRVVNGAATVLSQIKARFIEAPTLVPTDIVVAVGAVDLQMPDNVVRSGSPGSIVRPAPMAKWLDMDDAKTELGL